MANQETALVKTELTEEQQMQHKAVLTSVQHNLNLVINQVESMDNARYDALLESLDTAKTDLESILETS